MTGKRVPSPIGLGDDSDDCPLELGKEDPLGDIQAWMKRKGLIDIRLAQILSVDEWKLVKDQIDAADPRGSA